MSLSQIGAALIALGAALIVIAVAGLLLRPRPRRPAPPPDATGGDAGDVAD